MGVGGRWGGGGRLFAVYSIFSQVFAKNSLIKNIFEKEKKFDSRT